MDVSWVTKRIKESSEIKLLLAKKQAGAISQAGHAIADALESGKKGLFFGNGGSAADAQHIAAELVVRFYLDRATLPAIALTTNASVITAISNDLGFENVFSRQIRAFGEPGDIAVAISTSGRSPNVIAGVEAAREVGLVSIGLTGGDGGLLADKVDIPIVVPSEDTARIQECHITIGHLLCEIAESLMFPDSTPLESDSEVEECRHMLPNSKIVDWATLLSLREKWRASGKTVVWTNGCFDVLHAGHAKSLDACGRLGDLLVVGVNSDESVRQLKGPGRPILSVSERVEMLAALECVDYVIVFEETTPERAIERLKPDIHCKGAEYKPPGGKPVPEAKTVEAYGGHIAYIPMVPHSSTSEIIKRILKKESHGC
jgi:phosphoheptose isomerase